jgi:hypothetical protein
MFRNNEKYLLDNFAYKEISKAILAGNYIGNYKCHMNSLNYALKHPKKVKAIVGCIQVFKDDSICAHFVVQLHNGDIIDPTYGRLADTYGYLIEIEHYAVNSFNPDRELNNLKRHLYYKLPWYRRIFASPLNF